METVLKKILPSFLSTRQQAVLRLLITLKKATHQTLVTEYETKVQAGEILVPQSSSGIRTRAKELADKGLIVPSPYRETLSSGRQAIVWTVSGDALEQALHTEELSRKSLTTEELAWLVRKFLPSNLK